MSKASLPTLKQQFTADDNVTGSMAARGKFNPAAFPDKPTAATMGYRFKPAAASAGVLAKTMKIVPATIKFGFKNFVKDMDMPDWLKEIVGLAGLAISAPFNLLSFGFKELQKALSPPPEQSPYAHSQYTRAQYENLGKNTSGITTQFSEARKMMETAPSEPNTPESAPTNDMAENDPIPQTAATPEAAATSDADATPDADASADEKPGMNGSKGQNSDPPLQENKTQQYLKLAGMFADTKENVTDRGAEMPGAKASANQTLETHAQTHFAAIQQQNYRPRSVKTL